jgi:hypothetical protein
MRLTPKTRSILNKWGYRFVYDDIGQRIVAYAPKDCRCLGNRVFSLA